MREAIIGFIGVIVGAIIGLFGQVLLLRFDYKKWKKEKTVEFLKEKKINLEQKYKEIRKKLYVCLETNRVSTDLSLDIVFIFPKYVVDAFNKTMEESDEKGNIKKENILLTEIEMRKSIKEIEKQIIDEIKIKK